MNGSQRRDLPNACRDLSAMLTTDRDSLDRPYWTAPRLTSAYLRYFLPWNLVRLCSLLPGLDFGRIPDEPLILDMGSGPLTLPLALWLSRPDLRAKPVTIVASDTTPHILELGRKLFEALRAELAPECRWTIRTMRASVTQALLWSCVRKPNGDKDITIGLHVGMMPLPKAPEEVLEPCFEDVIPVEAVEVPAEPEEPFVEV
jgi:hypothetical protein